MMRTTGALTILLAAASMLSGQPSTPSPIAAYPLSSEQPYNLPVHPQVGLTVSFPGKIGRPFGPGITSDPNGQDDYYIYVAPGASSFSIAVLNPVAPTRNLNVPYNGEVYTIFLTTVGDPSYALANLKFTDPADSSSAGSVRSGNITRMEFGQAVESKQRYAAVGEKRLIGFIDRLKMIHAARENELEETLSVLQGIDVAIFSKDFELRKGVRMRLVRVARDTVLDLVGFICIIENDTLDDMIVDRDSFRARAGSATYPPAIVKCPQRIEGRSVNSVYFVISGNGRGGPGHLSESNEWDLSLGVGRAKKDD